MVKVRNEPFYPVEDGVAIATLVVPGSSKPGIAGLHGDRVRLRVASPPERGRANAEAERLLSSLLGGRTTLVKGISSRRKVFVVAGVDMETVRRKLGV